MGNQRPPRRGQGKGVTGRETDATSDRDAGRKGIRWAKEDWAAWRKKLEDQKTEARSPAPGATKGRKEKKK